MIFDVAMAAEMSLVGINIYFFETTTGRIKIPFLLKEY